MDDIELYNGCLGVGESDQDFLLEEGDIDSLPTLFEQDDIYFEYNQNANEWSKKSCTLYNAIGAVSDLMNYEFTLDQIREIDVLSYTKGRVQGFGRQTKKAVDLVKNWRNNNKELVAKYGKVAYYRINMCADELIQSILDKNYTICWGFQGNSAYQQDYRADGVLDGYDFGKTKTYGHSVGFRMHNGVKCVKDNYKGRVNNGIPTNFYEIRPLCSQEVKGGTYYYWGYLFTKVAEDNYDELIRLEKVRVLCNNTLAANSALWNGTNDKVLQSKLHSISEYIRNNNLRYIENKKEELR